MTRKRDFESAGRHNICTHVAMGSSRCSNVQYQYQASSMLALKQYRALCRHEKLQKRDFKIKTRQVHNVAVDRKGRVKQGEHWDSDEPDTHVIATSENDFVKKTNGLEDGKER